MASVQAETPASAKSTPIPPKESNTTSQQNENIDDDEIDEGRDAYRAGGFHPVYIGDTFNDRYKVLNKIGYGQYSTVWLVKDMQASEDKGSAYRALKIIGADDGTFEKDILIHLRQANQSHPGYPYICHLVDEFEHKGPNGTHICLVFELMGETLRSFGAWFGGSMIPQSVMRKFAIQILLALDYAHQENIIHTDIKPDNIFVKFRNYSILEDEYLTQVSVVEQNRSEQQYTPIRSEPLRQYYFSEEESAEVDGFDVTLGDWGVASWATKHLTENIQPVALRAPEVLIKAPWDATTDWWNFGAVLIELFRAVRLFDGRVPPDGRYDLKMHLTEIVDLFGPFPRSLLEKGDKDIVDKMFDDEGLVRDSKPLDRPDLSSEAFLPGLDPEEREQFVSFMRLIMKIDPEERPSTMDLLRHPWLGAVA